MNSRTPPTKKRTAGSFDAVSVLLRNLIDYAGLFSPASLPMTQAVANYQTYSQSEWSTILGRFIVPAIRLDEFEAAFDKLPPLSGEMESKSWPLSVLLGSDLSADVSRVCRFNERTSSARRSAVIESVELKVATAGEVQRFTASIPFDLETYFEVPLSGCGDFIAAVSACRRRAKIRTGGETAEKVPASKDVIKFIGSCASLSVPFKATAGLHHPIKSVHRFTYHPDSPSGMMHGFLNVFLAAGFLWTGMKAELALELLDDKLPNVFHFGPDEVRWREHRLDRDAIAESRDKFAVSFGSCSFTEPIDDLRSISVLS